MLDDLGSMPRDRWTTVRYEDLIRDPRSEVTKLLKFAGLSMDPRLAEYLSKPLPISVTRTQFLTPTNGDGMRRR
ncbi:MAG: sulfotransferase [Steroidobacteraceae bacterium]